MVVPVREIDVGINISSNTEYSIHKSYLAPSKRFVWILGGWGPCSASCGGGHRQQTTACWDNKHNKVVKRTYCSLLVKPKLSSERCNTFGLVLFCFNYDFILNNHCILFYYLVLLVICGNKQLINL